MIVPPAVTVVTVTVPVEFGSLYVTVSSISENAHRVYPTVVPPSACHVYDTGNTPNVPPLIEDSHDVTFFTLAPFPSGTSMPFAIAWASPPAALLSVVFRVAEMTVLPFVIADKSKLTGCDGVDGQPYMISMGSVMYLTDHVDFSVKPSAVLVITGFAIFSPPYPTYISAMPVSVGMKANWPMVKRELIFASVMFIV